MQTRLSISIICFNEEAIIGECLEQAARVGDEIVIVDSGSTDKTLEIAQRYGARIFQQDWLGYGKQKNFALSKCSNDWVLSLDADEVLTDELILELQALSFDGGDAGYLGPVFHFAELQREHGSQRDQGRRLGAREKHQRHGAAHVTAIIQQGNDHNASPWL